MNTRILALDTATRTGWAYSEIVSGVIGRVKLHSGVADFSRDDDLGVRFAEFAAWLQRLLSSLKPHVITYEMIVGGHAAGGRTTLVQRGLEAIVLMECAKLRLLSSPVEMIGRSVFCISAGSIKKWATGSGKLTHESKAEVVRAATREFGVSDLIVRKPTKSRPWPFDDNQCDALWLLSLTEAVVRTNLIELLDDPETRKKSIESVTKARWKGKLPA